MADFRKTGVEKWLFKLQKLSFFLFLNLRKERSA